MSMFAPPLLKIPSMDGTGPAGNDYSDGGQGNAGQQAANQTGMSMVVSSGGAGYDPSDVQLVPTSMTPTGALAVSEVHDILYDLENQPAWRARADREMDYVDGNQLNSEILRRQQEIGMPPAIEPLIGPTIDIVTGLEAKNRADWKVTPNSEHTDPAMAEAMGFELNQAEKKSHADKACSEAYRGEISVGLGWVEVSRNNNPFEFQYRAKYVPRNEIWWDWLSTESDLSDARYLVRRRWTDTSQVALMFPKSADLVTQVSNGWQNYGPLEGMEGGASTNLHSSWLIERGWTIEEMQWRQNNGKRVCLFEIWYRRWVRVAVLKSPDGRVVEYDENNPAHVAAVVSGVLSPQSVVIPKMRRCIWMGPHCLDDGPTPYPHQRFPYVAFWGKREDRTQVPYGMVRGMIYLQDNINATMSKLRWGLSAVRVQRTQGATVLKDAQFRREVARPDADIVLDAKAMAVPGAMFKVERDFQLTDQQFKLAQDSRDGILRVGAVQPAIAGGSGTATSGVQESTQIEQSTQALADYVDNFNYGRAAVGELLLALIVEDLIGVQKTVAIQGNGLKPNKSVGINQPMIDAATGQPYLNNDVERAMLKVEINEVPTTSSYRAQQLSALSEAMKGMPDNLQAIAMPYLVNFMDIPEDIRADFIQKVQAAAGAPTPEAIQQQIQQAVQQALQKADQANKSRALDLKQQELSAKYPDPAGKASSDAQLAQAQIDKLRAEIFGTTTDALYAANQTAATIAMNPAIAPVADEVARLAGYVPPNPVGVDPGFPTMAGPVQPAPAAPVVSPAAQVTPQAQAQAAASQPGAQPAGMPVNTNPVFPPRAPTPGSPQVGQHAGIETQRTTDNLPAAG